MRSVRTADPTTDQELGGCTTKGISAWFKSDGFRVTLTDPHRSRLRAGSRGSILPGLGASAPHETRVPQQLQPVPVRLTRQQLRRALSHAVAVLAPEIPAVVQEEPEQRQVVLTQVPPQEEVAPQAAVEVLHQAAGTHDSH